MVNFQINYEQVKRAVKKLSLKDRARLVQELQKDTWKEEFKELLREIRADFKKNPIPQRKLDRIIEDAREEYYHARRRH